MNSKAAQVKYFDAITGNAIFSFEFDVSTGIIEQEIISGTGINYTKMMGFKVPYHFDVSLREPVLQEMGISYVYPVEKNCAITQGFLLSAYEQGRRKLECVVHCAKEDNYLELTYYLRKAPEDGHIWALVVCEDISEVWKMSKTASVEARNMLLESLNKSLQDQIKMVGGLTTAVIVAYQANLRTGEYIPAKVSDFSRLFTEGCSNIRNAFEQYIPRGVQPEDVEIMRLFTDIDTLADRLATVDVIDLIFQSTVAEREWNRAKWIATDRDADGTATYALFVVEDITRTVKLRESQRIELEEQYRLDQHKMRTMMEAIHGGFKISRNNRTFSFITISEQLAHMLGYTSSEEMMEASGGSMAGIANLEDAARAMPEALRSVIEGRMYTMHYRMRCRDGSWKNVEDRGRLIRLPNGEEEYWSFIIDQDELTQKTEALAAAEHAQAELLSMNAISEAAARDVGDLFLLDLKTGTSTTIKLSGHVIPEEKRSRRQYDETWSWFADNYVHPEDREGLSVAVELPQVLSALEINTEYHHRFRVFKDDAYHYCQVTFSYVGEEGSDLIVFGFRNIDKLISEERTKVAEIAELNYRLEKANKAKTSFLFNMSHDIRTPMNVILGYSRLIKKELTDPNLLHYHEKMEEASEYLLSLINNVLDMARIESGKMEVNAEPAALGELSSGIFSVYETSAREKGLQFIYSKDVKTQYVYSDHIKVKEIFSNLFSNAIKYTPSGGTVRVLLSEFPAAREGYVNIRTVVEDTGIGMSREFLSQIFDEFTRDKNTTESKTPGTGLGMAIVKRLVDLLGGTIEVESEIGKGTKITVTLPHKIADEKFILKKSSAVNITQEQMDSLKGKKILLAEDNDLNAEIAIELLSEIGVEVERAEDGVVCIDMLRKSEFGYYDLILMDIQMPNLNGYDAARKIRRAGLNIPIIAMTANAFEEDERNAISAGMNGHVAKPIDMNKLTEKLVEVLQ